MKAPAILSLTFFMFLKLLKQLRQLLDVIRLADQLDSRFQVVRLRKVAVLMQSLLKLLLANRRAEFYGVAFDH